MHFSLVLVGAHDGSKMEPFVRQASAVGHVLLVEPVPFLFDKLKSRYAVSPNVTARKIAISTKDGNVEFTAPKETANSIGPVGDQLGSLVSSHAIRHFAQMSQHIETITVDASSFETLVKTEQISSLHTLLTDTEGMDAELLPTFPFSIVVPKRIIFEFKHSDGPFRVGRKLASLLIFLEDRGYRINVLDAENMVAMHESYTP